MPGQTVPESRGAFRWPTQPGVVGLLVRAAAGLAVLAGVAQVLMAVIPVDLTEEATRRGGAALAVSLLRSVSIGALWAAACILQFIVLVMCFRGVRFCLGLLRGRRAGSSSG